MELRGAVRGVALFSRIGDLSWERLVSIHNGEDFFFLEKGQAFRETAVFGSCAADDMHSNGMEGNSMPEARLQAS